MKHPDQSPYAHGVGDWTTRGPQYGDDDISKESDAVMAELASEIDEVATRLMELEAAYFYGMRIRLGDPDAEFDSDVFEGMAKELRRVTRCR